MKYDATNYCGTNSSGEYIPVSEMSKEELQQNLCMCMDAIERLEIYVERATGVISDWHEDLLDEQGYA